MLLDNGFDYYPLKAFQKRVNKNRLLGGYSIKGIESVDSKKEKELKDVKVGDPCKLLWAGKWNNATVTSIEGNMVFWQLDNGKFHGSSNYTRDSGIKIEESIQFSSVRESNYSLERRLRRLEATVGVSNRKQTKSRMSESYRNGYKYFSNEEIRGMNSSTFSEIGNAYDYWCEENDGRPEAEDLIEMLDGVSESEIHRFLDNVEY